MAIQPVNLNNNKTLSFKEKKEYRPYLEADELITTENKVKPLPPKGHLVADNPISGTKYFFKDIGYDLKALKDGYKGNANDHQLGRLNDVGLRLGGIGIAAYLASRTKSFKVRLMEYVGLGTFLTVMALYPKIFINTPAKIINGYDVDKEYIDDQGRKKSVQQDSNYVPYDMYLGKKKDEDLQAIGDRMGIPKDIKNRNDLTREQMRKVATQNNTLWMLTAGITPALTALACYGLENYVITPSIVKAKMDSVSKKIDNAYGRAEKMSFNNIKDKENDLSKTVGKLLKEIESSEAGMTQEAFEELTAELTQGLESTLGENIKKDLEKILKPSEPMDIDKTYESIKMPYGKKNKLAKLMKDVLPTKDEFTTLVKESGTADEFDKKFADFVYGKARSLGLDDDSLYLIDNKLGDLRSTLKKEFKVSEKTILNADKIKEITDFARIIGELKENRRLLDECENFKFEYAPDTVIARSSAKFEKAIIKEFNLSMKELKLIRDSEEYASKILNKKLEEISKDDSRFEKFIKNLGEIAAEMETNLNGKNADSSEIKKLINGYEYLYNNGVKCFEEAGIHGDFKNTIKHMTGIFPNKELKFNTVEEVFEYLNGINAGGNESISLKDRVIARVFDRYQDCKNTFNRFLHTMDVFRRLNNEEEFKQFSQRKDYLDKIKELMISTSTKADAASQFTKLGIKEKLLYWDLMDTLYKVEGNEVNLKRKGYVTNATKEALEKGKNAQSARIVDSLQYFIARMLNLVKNNTNTLITDRLAQNYNDALIFSRGARTDSAIAKLIALNPVALLRGAAERKYSTQKWVRIIGGITAAVLSGTVLAQFCFGRIRNPQNVKKQVKDGTNN